MNSLTASFSVGRDYEWAIYILFAMGLVLWMTIKFLFRRRLSGQRELDFVFVTLAVGLVIFGLTQSTLLTKLQTAVLTARISSVGHQFSYAYKTPEQQQVQLRSQFQKFGSIADVSYRYHIPVNSNTLTKTTQKVRAAVHQPKLSEGTKEAGWGAYGKLNALAAEQATEDNTKTPGSFGYVINSNLPLENTKLRIVGQHSPLVFGAGEITIQNSTVVFDGIDFGAQQAYYAAIYVGSGSSVVIRNSKVQNLDQTLDGITWVNVEFQHSMIRTRGGSFVLVDVTFHDCDLRWLSPFFAGQLGLDLQQRIERSNGQPITFAYEGNALPTTPKSE